MKICWDNLEKIRYSKRTGKFYIRNTILYIKKCTICNEDYLGVKNSVACSIKCGANTEKNKRQAAINGTKTLKYKTKEHVRKITETKRKNGNFLSKNNPMYGKKHTKETKKKISKNRTGVNKGIKRPNHSIRMSGNGNPNWQGGISYGDYCPLWKDKEYKEYIKKRDNYHCQNSLCRKTSKRLCIHHINYDKRDCRPYNLIAVCFSCNARANFNRDFWQDYYNNIISEKYCYNI